MTHGLVRSSASAALFALALCPALVSCSDAAERPAGQALYLQHCAACHGEAGDGKGPLAESLRRPPSDLRTIASKNDGRFDERQVMAVIDGRRDVAEHGPREMPVWGAMFEDESRPQGYPAYTSLLHSRALTDYLSSIQQKPQE